MWNRPQERRLARCDPEPREQGPEARVVAQRQPQGITAREHRDANEIVSLDTALELPDNLVAIPVHDGGASLNCHASAGNGVSGR